MAGKTKVIDNYWSLAIVWLLPVLQRKPCNIALSNTEQCYANNNQ